MLRCKVDILKLLKENGYSSYRLREDKIMGTRSIQVLRHSGLPSKRELDIICRITGRNVGDIIEYQAEDTKEVHK